MKPSPVKVISLKSLSSILFCKELFIKKQQAQIAEKDKRIATLEKLVNNLDRNLSGIRGEIKQAWKDGVATKDTGFMVE